MENFKTNNNNKHCNLDDLFLELKEELININFLSEFWEEKFLYLKQFYDKESSNKIFDVEEFDSLLTSGKLMSPHLDIVENGHKMKPLFTNSPSPCTNVQNALERYKSGATIRVPHIELFMPDLQLYCRNLEKFIGVPIRANLYMTPPFSQGFQPHYDLDDIFVLQTFGHKIWSYHEKYSNMQPLPNQDMAFDASLHQPIGIPKEITLDCGDMLYLPRGFMHEARTEDEHSIHVTFAFIGNSMGVVMQQMLRARSIVTTSLRKLVRVPQQVNDEFILQQFKQIQSEFDSMPDKKLVTNSLNFMKQSFDAHRNPILKGKLVSILKEED